MDYKYISRFPTPFLEDLIKNRCTPFIGAGFSKNAELPKGKSIPDWDELGKKVSSMIPGYQYNGALDAISAFSHEFSRSKLIEKLAEYLLINSSQPGIAHKAFCEIPFELICTTNFDFLLEKGYEIASRYSRPIIDEEQLAIRNLDHSVAILKFHGDLHHPNKLVVTEEDYDSFIESRPMMATFLANILISNTALFIGYSLDDYDFRQIWQLIKNRLGRLRRNAYTLAVDCSAHDVARFERRGIKVINIPGSKKDYPKILSDIFAELKDYWEKGVIKYGMATDEERLIQLTVPESGANTLCFFSVPIKLIPFYKEYIFPIAENLGVTPISADEFISAGQNAVAKVSALIDRASLVVIDMTTSWSQYELGVVLSKKNKDKVAIIREEDSAVHFDASVNFQITRSKDPFENIEAFKASIEKFIRHSIGHYEGLDETEAKRLLSKGEYRAAVISAFIYFEGVVRSKFPNEKRKAVPLRDMFNLLVHKNILSADIYPTFNEYLHIRNLLVHTNESVDSAKAKKIVSTILSWVTKIKSFEE